MISKIRKELGFDKINKTLYKTPIKIKGKNIAHFQVEAPNIIHQCDLLMLPNDDGYRYALVLVDIYNGKTFALPSKNKKPEEILKLIKQMYLKNKILRLPETLQCDNGGEFKGVFKKYFDDNNVRIRYGKVGRHKNQAFAESRNKTIGKLLFQYMTAVESITGQPSLDWVDILPVIIKELNKHVKKIKVYNYNDNIPYQTKADLEVLDNGQKVRLKLDAPKEYINDNKLHGTFRAGDIRWTPEIHTITNTIMLPNQPILYFVDNMMFPAYGRNELQVIEQDDDEPDGDKLIIKNKKDRTYIVKNIIGKKKINNKLYYNVLWKGFVKPSWTLKSELNKDIIKEYEESLKA